MSHRDKKYGQRGFAMLFVFLLAAMVAISLYMEMPRVVFESQRDKEQMLIERGEQYKRAIQLYYRQFRVYPPNLDALENTNNRRFLRRRYIDPMTGQEEWRVIRGFPNGIFIDSLVYKTSGQTQTSSSSTTSSSEAAGQALWQQRRPSDETLPPNPELASSTPTMEPPPDNPAYPGGQPPAPVTEPGELAAEQAGATPVPAQPAAPGIPVVPAIPGVPPGGATPGPTAGMPGMQPVEPGQPSSGNPAVDIIRALLTTPNPRALSAIQVSGNNPQPGGSAGIAGVASKLEANSIKVYNDRSKYNEWEFIYDPRLDALAAALAPPVQQQQIPSAGQPGGQGRGVGGQDGRGRGAGSGQAPGRGPIRGGPSFPFGPPGGFGVFPGGPAPGGSQQPAVPGRGR